MKLLAALCVLGLASCSGNRAVPSAPTAEAPAAIAAATGVSPAHEPVWIARGPAQATIPEAFRGRWDASAESCLTISDAELKVGDESLTFWEVGVDVQAVTPVGVNIIRIEGKGYEAEEAFDWKGVFQLSADGNMLTMNPGPGGFARVRCLTPDFPGAEKQ